MIRVDNLIPQKCHSITPYHYCTHLLVECLDGGVVAPHWEEVGELCGLCAGPDQLGGRQGVAGPGAAAVYHAPVVGGSLKWIKAGNFQVLPLTLDARTLFLIKFFIVE